MTEISFCAEYLSDQILDTIQEFIDAHEESSPGVPVAVDVDDALDRVDRIWETTQAALIELERLIEADKILVFPI